MAIKFGTEGWRAIMAEEFTADNVRIVTQAIADHLLAQGSAHGPRAMTVGHDTRFLSDHFARAVAEVLAANGIQVVLTDRAVPTCAVSRAVLSRKQPLGVMVTASHNPAIYNGIKVKEWFGGSANPDSVESIERRIGQTPVKRISFEAAQHAGPVTMANLLPDFLKGIKAFLDFKAIKRSRFTVLVESMHGAGGRLIEGLLEGGQCRVQTLHPDPDARFGGRAPEPIAANLGELIATMKRTKANLGIANDGDADRLGIIGPGGVWLNPGQVMCVLLLHLVRHRKASGAVVKTVSNTMMINRLVGTLGLRLIEVPVGFKHVAKLMLEDDVLVGGEESGGIGVKGYMPERDGLLTGLLALEAMAVSRKTLSQLMAELEAMCGSWHYGRRDLHLKMEQVDALFARLHSTPPDQLAGVPVVHVNRLDGVKLIGRDESWLLFRRSGTEPIVRIYAETPRRPRLSQLLNLGVRLAAGDIASALA